MLEVKQKQSGKPLIITSLKIAIIWQGGKLYDKLSLTLLICDSPFILKLLANNMCQPKQPIIKRN